MNPLKDNFDKLNIEPSPDVWNGISDTLKHRAATRRRRIAAAAAAAVAAVAAAVLFIPSANTPAASEPTATMQIAETSMPSSADNTTASTPVSQSDAVPTPASQPANATAVINEPTANSLPLASTNTTTGDNTTPTATTKNTAEPATHLATTGNPAEPSAISASTSANTVRNSSNAASNTANASSVSPNTVRTSANAASNTASVASTSTDNNRSDNDKNQTTKISPNTNKVSSSELAVWIPNAFSPDDPTNDDIRRFKVIPNEDANILSFEIFIYARGGHLVYHSRDINDSWDGTSNGKPQPMGTYVYVLQLNDAATGLQHHKGTITLLR